MINTIPTQLSEYIEIKDGQIVFKKELPVELRNEFEEFKKNYEVSKSMLKFVEEYQPVELTELDREFEIYCNLYKQRFNKSAYIPEPNGTKQFAIECIKKCLQENRDILDDLYYPNFKKNMENGVLYSEMKNDLDNKKVNNDRFTWNKGEINIANTQCELCKYNNETNHSVCSEYPDGKLEDVISNNIRCPKFKGKNSIF